MEKCCWQKTSQIPSKCIIPFLKFLLFKYVSVAVPCHVVGSREREHFIWRKIVPCSAKRFTSALSSSGTSLSHNQFCLY